MTITDLDGANGILRYRGYPIEQLAEQSAHTVALVEHTSRLVEAVQVFRLPEYDDGSGTVLEPSTPRLAASA